MYFAAPALLIGLGLGAWLKSWRIVVALIVVGLLSRSSAGGPPGLRTKTLRRLAVRSRSNCYLRPSRSRCRPQRLPNPPKPPEKTRRAVDVTRYRGPVSSASVGRHPPARAASRLIAIRQPRVVQAGK